MSICGVSNRDLACTFLLASLGLALGDLGVAQQAAQPAPKKPLAPETRLLTDDFSIDSRSQYEITGRVDWGKGKLTLHPGATVRKKIEPQSALDLTLDIELPAPSGSEKAAQFQVDLELDTGELARLVFDRVVRKEGPRTDIRILGPSAPAGHTESRAKPHSDLLRETRRYASLPGFAYRPLQIGYRIGMVRAGREPGALVFGYPVAYSGAEPARVTALRFTSVAGELALASIRITAPAQRQPPSPSTEQRQRLKKAETLNSRIDALHEADKDREAVPLAREALRIFRDVLGPEHAETIAMLSNLSFLCQSTGEYAEALALQQRSLEIHREVFGPEHPETVIGLNNLATLYESMGERAEALAAFQEALRIRRKVLGSEHADTALSLHNLAFLYQQMGADAKAAPAFQEAFEIRQRVLGPEHPDTAASLCNLASAYSAMGEYAKALPLCSRSVRILRKTAGPEHADTAAALSHLGELYFKMGDYAKALPLDQQVLAIYRKLHGRYHPDTATALSDLAELYVRLGDYAKALPLHGEALAIRLKVLGPEHSDTAASLSNLADLYCLMGEYSKALPLQQHALEIWRKVFGPEHRYVSTSLDGLSNVHQLMGQYDVALSLQQQALEISRKVLGPEHPETVTSLNNLAYVYDAMGEYGKASSLYRQAADIRQRILGAENPETATTLNNLASALEKMGESAEALSLYRRALEIHRKTLGPEHPLTAGSMSNLAGLYCSRGDYAQALPLYKQVLEIHRKVLGPEHPDTATSLSNLAILYCSMGEPGKALPLERQALEICRKLFGPARAETALRLGNLATIYCAMGEYAKGASLFQQAVEIHRKALGPYHYLTLVGLNELARVHYIVGDYAKASEVAVQAARGENDLALNLFPTVSEAQALNFTTKALGPPSLLLSASRHTNRPTDDVYGCVWMRRGLIQQITAVRQRQLHVTASPEVRRSYASYQDAGRTLARLILAPAASDPNRLAARRKRIEQLGKEKERLERQLAAELPDFQQQLQSQRRPHADLAKSLPPNAAFVDFVRYAYLEHNPKVPGKAGDRSTESYVAFVLRHGAAVARVELGRATPIHRAVARWQKDIAAGATASPAADQLRRLVWEPIEEKLTPATKTIYICPDDKLNFLAWSALPGGEPGTVLLEHYAIAAVPSGQFLAGRLISASRSAAEPGELLAVGGVAYDGKPVEAPHDHNLVAMRDAAVGDRHLAWPALAGTQQELNAVTALAAGRRVIKLQGAAASTAAVLTDLPRARWAHFATHGFLADPEIRSALQIDENSFGDQHGFSSGGERRTVAGRNPLVLSGLVFAGANLPRPKDAYGIARGDGGILTAEAIAALPLEKLELAVLSACNTGQGDVAGGEGVMGLTRAFHLAGARNVVASLWKVDDNATAKLMELFYRNLWAEQMSPLEALRQAQLEIYHHPELIEAGAVPRQPVSGQPHKIQNNIAPNSRTAPARQWAAFILSGAGS